MTTKPQTSQSDQTAGVGSSPAGRLKRLFELAGDIERFDGVQYRSDGELYGRMAKIGATSRACEFMMEAARNVGDLMAAARDHAATVEELRDCQRLIAEIADLCENPKTPNALAAIASRVVRFTS